MGYLYLTIAIIAEVVATNALKASEGFTKLVADKRRRACRGEAGKRRWACRGEAGKRRRVTHLDQGIVL